MPAIDLTDAEHAAVTAAVWRTIETDRFPRAPRLDPLRDFARVQAGQAAARPLILAAVCHAGRIKTA